MALNSSRVAADGGSVHVTGYRTGDDLMERTVDLTVCLEGGRLVWHDAHRPVETVTPAGLLDIYHALESIVLDGAAGHLCAAVAADG